MYFRIYYSIPGYGKSNSLSQDMADAINEQAYFMSSRTKGNTVSSFESKFWKGNDYKKIMSFHPTGTNESLRKHVIISKLDEIQKYFKSSAIYWGKACISLTKSFTERQLFTFPSPFLVGRKATFFNRKHQN